MRYQTSESMTGAIESCGARAQNTVLLRKQLYDIMYAGENLVVRLSPNALVDAISRRLEHGVIRYAVCLMRAI